MLIPLRQSAQTDEQLMKRAAHGSDRAFEELYNRHARRLQGFFARRLGDDADLAPDFMHDTFLRLYVARETYREGSSFRAWLYAIAYNQWKNHIRRRGSPSSQKPKSPSFQEGPGEVTSPSSQEGPGEFTSPSSQEGLGEVTSPSSQEGPGEFTSPSSQEGPGEVTSPSFQEGLGEVTSPSFQEGLGEVEVMEPEAIELAIDEAILHEALRNALKRLPDPYALLFSLHYEEELTIPQIAHIASLPEGTVKSRLHKAMNIIKQYLKQYENR